MRYISLLLSILLVIAGCKKAEDSSVNSPTPLVQVEKNIQSEVGGTLSTSDGLQLIIPPKSLPTSGNVFLGVTGNEPKKVTNQDLKIIGNPFTIRIPSDPINNPMTVSFPKPEQSTSVENYCVFLFNGSTYYPIDYSVSGNIVTAVIDKTNWESSRSLRKKKSDEKEKILSEIIILGLIATQTPLPYEMGLKRIDVSSNGDVTYSSPSASSNSKILLLIHGWNGRPHGWKAMVPKIVRDIINPSYSQIWTFGYNACWSIDANATELVNALSQNTNGAKVDIVAHSMGGLIARSCIEKKNAAGYVNKLITLGTPHLGSPLAAIRGFLGGIVLLTGGLGEWAVYNCFTQGFEDLETNSSFIIQLKTTIKPAIKYYTIAARNDDSWFCSKYILVPDYDDGVVAESSAWGVDGAIHPTSTTIPVWLAHCSLMSNESVYQQILSYLKTSSTSNNPPAVPTNPNPANGATGISTSPTLSWSCSDPDGDALTYDVYFGVSTNPTTQVATGQSAVTLTRNGLLNSTTYYWKVNAKDSKGATTTGPVWNFTTTSSGTITNGLVAYYPFTGNALDASGNGNNGQVYGATLATDRFNSVNKSYSFNGTTDSIRVLNAPSLNPSYFTLAGWVYYQDAAYNAHVFNKSQQIDFFIEASIGDQIGCHINNVPYRTGIAVLKNQWTFLTVTMAADSIKIYKNSILLSSWRCTGPVIATPANWTFGSRSGDAGTAFQGKIDDIRLFNRPLSIGEINTLYHENGW